MNRRTRGIISSNAYDLAPLGTFLEEVAKAFPNAFPRNVDKALVKQVSSRLSPREPGEGPLSDDDEATETNFFDHVPSAPTSATG